MIGREFTVDMLCQLASDMDKESIKKDLVNLQIQGLLSLEPDPNLSYSFNNVLRDVIYDQMLFAQRRTVHSKILEIYQKKYAGQPVYYDVIAYHSKQAGNNRDAIEKYIGVCKLP